MKRFKKYLSLILMVIFTLSMSMAAFAQGTITVADPQDGATYTAYKIFDVDKNDEDVLTYTIKHSPHTAANGNLIIDWFDVVKDFRGLSFKLLTDPADPYSPYVDTDGNYTYIVTKQSGFSAADFADTLLETLRGTLNDPDSEFETGTAYTGNPDINVLDPGYYMVTTTIVDENNNEELLEKAALTIVTDGDTVIIQDKIDMPFEKTVDQVKEEDVEVGQLVQYEITAKVPSTQDYDNYAFIISDTMGKGLTFMGNVHVYIEAAEGQGYFTRDVHEDDNNLRVDFVHMEGDHDTNDLIEVPMQELANSELDTTQDQIKYSEDGFKLCLNMMTRQNLVNNKIYVVYDAEINSEAVVRVSENKAVLVYGHDDDLTIKDDSSKVYTSRILIDKFEIGNISQKLSGAEFILRRAIPRTDDPSSVDHYEYYAWREKHDPEDSDDPETLVGEEVVWLDIRDEERALDLAIEGIISKAVTDDNGAAQFDGLADFGSYEVIEIKAPDGYTPLAAPISIMVDGTGATEDGLSEDHITAILTNVISVGNNPSSDVPITGGMGTTLFYIAGAIMVFGAVIVLVTRKRMSE